ELAERPRAAQIVGAKNAAELVAMFKLQEADIGQVAAAYLTPDQIAELRKLSTQWLATHPDERYVVGVRLEDFAKAQQHDANIPGQQVVSGVFGMLTLNPFRGLDPAVEQVEQTRVLAERMFFYGRQLPVLLTWQADSLYLQVLCEPQVKQLVVDTN